MASTQTKIETITVGAGGQATIDFSNIPQTYSHLVLKISGKTTLNGDADLGYIRFNGVSTGYSSRRLQGDGVTANSSSLSEIYFRVDGSSASQANYFGNAELFIPNYAGSTQKSVSVDSVEEGPQTNAFLALFAGLSTSTSAITSISLIPNNGSWAEGTSATLYGIAAARAGAKATGGEIREVDGYIYHTFTASGTFTPTQALTAEILVVAGGGGGGGGASGNGGGSGGGGGGVLALTSQSLTATGYTVTVGAGGPGGSGANGSNGSDSQFGALTLVKGGGYGVLGVSGTGRTGGTGGSGGGGGFGTGTGGTGGSNTSGQGFNGGSGFNYELAGGGGGAGEAGNTDGNATGGDGTNAYSVWTGATGTGVGNYLAGGGSGGGGTTRRNGGDGGGGMSGGSGGSNGVAGTANTGGGGGGGGDSYYYGTTTGGNGGSGVVIVRYLK